MKKIIAIVAVIAVITACFCIGASAAGGITLNDGDEIVFKNTLSYDNVDININFICNNHSYKKIYTFPISEEVLSNSRLRYSRSDDDTSANPYDFYNQTWLTNNWKTITVIGNQTITNNHAIEWLYKNTESGLPTRPLEKTVDNTKTTFSAVLFVGSLIISWLVANQICLVGLYLYIMIALSATARRFIKGG